MQRRFGHWHPLRQVPSQPGIKAGALGKQVRWHVDVPVAQIALQFGEVHPGVSLGLDFPHLASTAYRPTLPPPDNYPVIQPNDTLLLFDFTDPTAVDDWAVINDRLMGGMSRSKMRHGPAGHAVFEGTVSRERNGGFASARSSQSTRGKPTSASHYRRRRRT